jgi:hypothetical protein
MLSGNIFDRTLRPVPGHAQVTRNVLLAIVVTALLSACSKAGSIEVGGTGGTGDSDSTRVKAALADSGDSDAVPSPAPKKKHLQAQ